MDAPDRSGSSAVWITGGTAISVVLAVRFFGPSTFYVTEREWQTAITSWWMTQSGSGLFSAITPIMGPPWRLPLELPVFQWLAAILTIDRVGIEDTGRMVSLIAFLFNVAVVHRLALDLDFTKRAANCAAILMLSSPLFLAYSFSFTIESSANLLSALWLWLLVRWLRDPNSAWLSAALIVGSMAALVKPTTWAVYATVAGVLAIWAMDRARRFDRSPALIAVGTTVMVGVPLAAGLAWTSACDSVKGLNPLTAQLSSRAISAWTFGTIEQRLSVDGWVTVLTHFAVLVLGPATSLAVLIGVLRLGRTHRPLPPRGLVFALLAGVVAGPVIFTNLYFQHDYYAMAGGIFAILLATVTLLGDRPRPLLICLLIACNLATTTAFLLVKQANYDDPLSDALAQAVINLPADHHLVIFGSYMDSRIPYLARHKALQTRETDPKNAAVTEVLGRIPASEIGVVLTRSERFFGAAQAAAKRYSLTNRVELAPGVRLYFASELRRYLTLTPIDLEGEYAHRIKGFDPATANRWGIMLPSGPDAAPGIGLSRGGNLYLFDVKRDLRVVHRRWAPRDR